MLRPVYLAAGIWSLVSLGFSRAPETLLEACFLAVQVAALVSAVVALLAVFRRAPGAEQVLALSLILAGAYGSPLDSFTLSKFFVVLLPLALWELEGRRPMPNLLKWHWPAVAGCASFAVPFWTDLASMLLLLEIARQQLAGSPRALRYGVLGGAIAVAGCAHEFARQDQLGWVLGALFFGPLILYPAAKACRCAVGA